MEPGAQLGCLISQDLKLCSLHDGAVCLFLVFSGAWTGPVLLWVFEMILVKRLLLVGIMKRLLPFIDWHRREIVYTRKILDFYLDFLGRRCLGEREHGIWGLESLNRLKEKIPEAPNESGRHHLSFYCNL